MSNFPNIPETIDMLKRHRDKHGYTNAQLASNMTTFGWTWNETRVADLISGRSKLTADDEAFIKLYLLQEFYDYNCE